MRIVGHLNCLHNFLVDFKVLAKDGFIYENIEFKSNLAVIICDVPTRAFLKCIKGHNG